MGFFDDRLVLVLLESLAGTGHKRAMARPRLGDKLDCYLFDPIGKLSSYFELLGFFVGFKIRSFVIG